ncbi:MULTISPECIES: SLC13 family permease [Euryhalocaulis]|uniref:SLC13 family permease n=1 Tax=Euryhalocaulis TaxID=1712422 RepID=UPI0003A33045|nr:MULTISPECIES: SLC13 family permease [Euryhalocaulis]MBA4802713.1 SLC13 family permease [Euryhalocaulis sp.]
MDLAAGGGALMWAVMASIGVIVVLYATERFSIELISAGVIAFFLLLFQIFPAPVPEGQSFGPAELLSGFANPALITIMALLVIGQGMFQTGAMDGPTRRLTASYERHPRLTLLTVFGFMFVVSAFINNTPVVVMFIPIMAAIAQRMGGTPSGLMMPLSFVAIFAGATTLIGSSTNLLVSDVLRQTRGFGLEFFQPTLPGLVLAGAGIIYLLVAGRFLMPRRVTMEGELKGATGRQFIAQIEVTPGHPLVGKKPVMGMFQDLPNMTVRMIQRREHAILPPFDDAELQEGDLVIVATTRKNLTELLSSRAEFLRGMMQLGDFKIEEGRDETLMMSEAVIAPASRFIGRTIEQVGFRYQTGCIVLGVQRRSRMIRTRMGEIRLEAGDTLLIFGPESAIKSLRNNKDVLILEWATQDVPDIRRAALARLTFGGIIVASALGLVPIVVASVVGATIMVAGGCLNGRQAIRSLDMRVFMLIGAAFAMGGSLQATGGAGYLANVVVDIFAPYGSAVLISALFLLVAILTNILSNSATAILFAPIAIQAAQLVDAPPEAFVLTVLFGANCCFATPIAYQTNLLVMGPGHYRFMDFLRVGGPLVLVFWIVYSLFAPWYFGL